MRTDDSGLLSGQDFIVFGEDFGRHAHSLEHLLRPLFAKNRFIWVETIGIRSPKLSLYDLKRIYEKLGRWFAPQPKTPGRVIPETVTIVSPLMIPLNQFSVVRMFNRWSVRRAVSKTQKSLAFKQAITVSSVPNAADYVGDFGEILKVYVCVDEFSLWPGLDYEMVRGMEEKILLNSDLVFGTSQALVASKSNGRRATVLLTHGVDFKHFDIGPKSFFSSPLKLCYFGLFDERSDQEILKVIAKQVPDAEIHIIGNTVCDTGGLSGCPNVIFHGPVPYAGLPKAIAEMDIFLLPYVRNELTESINPLKLKEYLSTGRPVIATALPEVVQLQQHLYVASSGEEFVALINKIRTGALKPETQMTRDFLLKNETWNSKARLFSSTVEGALGD